MKYTSVMKNREKVLEMKWKDEGDGYSSLKAIAHFPVCYIAIPPNHKDVGVNYENLCPMINGGFTFGKGNVFGWHYKGDNIIDIKNDIKCVIKYFKSRDITNNNMLLVE